ncbi:hypothetical protein TL5118_02059 [Thalassovita autumnalis]|uniref:DUF4139 domain-containing protein n=1 Tax=Thalassovita autumnalis TaxID=2072972 RepID=A0A0N7LX66_9RHOB|nr:DUF4139 domain-containing protein [Thalassovita autumnalis]CUH67130.1 hypothetical protein TL5118_02059 [Thalassovita autumnalis]CUH71047.1 hypothetical protein TL5120_00827 [Thalassovita autumnalis]
MRALPFLLSTALASLPANLLPSVSLAETFQLTSQISNVIVYPNGAKVTRTAQFDLPAGSHQLQVLDLPQSVALDGIRAKLTGAQLGAVTLRDDFVPPRAEVEDAARAAAERRLEAAREELQAHQDDIRSLQLSKEAADTAIGFLRGLTKSDALSGLSAEDLRDIARMMGEETFAARQAVLEADAEARQLSRDLPELQQAVDKAQQALDALVRGQDEVLLVEVAASASAASEATLEISYFIDAAGWRPVNDASLTLDSGLLQLDRGALVEQNSGENWQDVSLTLSTSQPSGKVAASQVYSDFRQLVEPHRALAKVRSESAAPAFADMAAPMLEVAEAEPVVMAPPVALAGGLILTYPYPQPVSIATGADAAKLSLGTLSFEATIEATAVPLYDQTAFLTAKILNDSGEEILPSPETLLYLDGELVGRFDQPMLAAGDDLRLPFGPIEGLQLRREVTRNQGDRGILSKSNDRTEAIRITVDNLTNRAWDMRLIDRVPYGEQDDLQITWSTLPEPSETDLDGRRGVLAWTFPLAAGAEKIIKLNQRISWPGEMELIPR